VALLKPDYGTKPCNFVLTSALPATDHKTQLRMVMLVVHKVLTTKKQGPCKQQEGPEGCSKSFGNQAASAAAATMGCTGKPR
jgi:hypothetical protein